MNPNPASIAAFAANPVITGEYHKYAWPIWLILFVAVLGLALMIGSLANITVKDNDPGLTFGFSIVVGALCELAVFGVGVQPHDARAVDNNRVAGLVSEHYDLTSITPVDDKPDDPSSICDSVSPTSPEYHGVWKGNQITVKIGIADCDTENPAPDILIVDAPDRTVTVEDLEKRTEEKP